MDAVVDPGCDRLWTCASREALNRTTFLALQALGADYAVVFDILGPEPRVVATAGVEPRLADDAASLCRAVMATGMPARHGASSGVPVPSRHLGPIGAFCVIRRETRGQDSADLQTLEALASGLGEQIDLAHRLHEIESGAQSRLAAMLDVNHELRTPLQAIVGFTEFLTSETRPHLIAEHVRTIQAAAQSVLAIINHTLEAAGAVEMPEDVAEVTIRPFAETCLSMVGPAAIEKGLSSRLVVEADVPPRVALDRQKVMQALLNLLNNAVKFTDRGGLTLHIRRAGTGLHFAVADTGIGIAAEECDRLFQRFSRIDTARETDGTGLGLAITKTLVESMSGTIGVELHSGGTIFWFEVPAAIVPGHMPPTSAPASTTDTTSHPAPSKTSAATASGRILLADDLDLNRKLIADMLAIDGYAVDTVADGAAAVKAASEQPYALVLMDMIMPGMDGLAAARAIRALPAPACHVPIVALTANSADDQLESCLKAGMNATLTKPMTFDGLSSAVATWLGRRSEAA